MSGAVDGPVPTRAADLVGRTVGRYRLHRRIGEGGMGVVYLGVGPDQRAVAVKVLRGHIAGDPEARRRLTREVETLRRVRHERVAQVLDADVDGHLPFLATEFVDGDGLEEYVRSRGGLVGADLARIGFGLGDALAAIHRAGVVHRDLKPGNVLVVDGEPVVIDFGIAHATEDSRLTMTGLIMGTPGYLSPELLEGGTVDRATDWWGWAATVAFAATGRAPFGRGPMEVVLDRVRRGESDLDGVPLVLVPALRAALSPEPSRRPRPGELRQALSQLDGAADLTRAKRDQSAATILLPDASPALVTTPSAPYLPPPVPATVLRARARAAADQRSATAAIPTGEPTRPFASNATRVQPTAEATLAVSSEPTVAAALPPATIPSTPTARTEPRRWFGRERQAPPAMRADLPVARATPQNLNPPLANQPLANQPLANQPSANQPLANQPLANRPAEHQRPVPPAFRQAPVQARQPAPVQTWTQPPQPAQRPADRTPAPVQPPENPRHDRGRADQPDRPRPRRTGTMLTCLLALVVAGVAAPIVTLVGFAALSALARMVDGVGWGLMVRRHNHGGRRGSDWLVAMASSPGHLVLGVVKAVFALVLPIVLGVSAYFATGLFWPLSDNYQSLAGLPPLAAAFAVLGVTSWWGPGGRSLRTGSRALARGLTPGRAGSVLAVGLMMLLVIAALSVLSRAGWVANWYPLDMSPLDHVIGVATGR